LAKVGGLVPGNLSGMFVDCHLYEDQIEGAKEQLKRTPGKLPYISIPDQEGEFDLFDWTYKDVALHDYHPQSKISFGDVVV